MPGEAQGWSTARRVRPESPSRNMPRASRRRRGRGSRRPGAPRPRSACLRPRSPRSLVNAGVAPCRLGPTTTRTTRTRRELRNGHSGDDVEAAVELPPSRLSRRGRTRRRPAVARCRTGGTRASGGHGSVDGGPPACRSKTSRPGGSSVPTTRKWSSVTAAPASAAGGRGRRLHRPEDSDPHRRRRAAPRPGQNCAVEPSPADSTRIVRASGPIQYQLPYTSAPARAGRRAAADGRAAGGELEDLGPERQLVRRRPTPSAGLPPGRGRSRAAPYRRPAVVRARRPVLAAEQELEAGAVDVHQQVSGTTGTGTTVVRRRALGDGADPRSWSSGSGSPASTEMPTTSGSSRPAIEMGSLPLTGGRGVLDDEHRPDEVDAGDPARDGEQLERDDGLQPRPARRRVREAQVGGSGSPGLCGSGARKARSVALIASRTSATLWPATGIEADGDPDALVRRAAEEDLRRHEPPRVDVVADRVEERLVRLRCAWMGRIVLRDDHQRHRTGGVAGGARCELRAERRDDVDAADLDSRGCGGRSGRSRRR